jgi:hypothetical protein
MISSIRMRSGNAVAAIVSAVGCIQRVMRNRNSRWDGTTQEVKGMTWKKGENADVVATPAMMQRFGIDENFDVDRNDPRNADYLTPLANPEAEAEAEAFAHGAYAALSHECEGFDSQEEDDACYEQMLMNGRKAAIEDEYAAIFENMGADLSPPEETKPESMH